MPYNADWLISRAEELYISGLCDEAVQLLTDALMEKRPEPAILTRLVELLIDSERYERALEIFEKFSHPNDTGAGLLLRAICHEALGDLASADQLVQALIANGQQLAETLVLRGQRALRSFKWESAEALFNEAIACDSGCGNAWFGLACLHQQRADMQKAFEFSKQAFSRFPGSRQIAIGFHQNVLDAQRPFEGESAIREALCERRMDRRLRFFLIDLILRQGRWEDAMTEIESVLADFGIDEGSLSAARMVRERLGPMSIQPGTDIGTTVSLCMIVKNESSHLPRCLIRAKPLVDEMIVVDTGSTDPSADIARVFGARVYDFRWVDDFSAARNFGLSKASGGWVLSLDADEVISAADCVSFRKLIESSQSQKCAYRVRTRNYSNQANTVGFRTNQGEYPEEKGLGWYPSDKVRLFPNDPRIRFEYPVHELVEPSLRKFKIPILDCTIAVHHYGTCNELYTTKKTINYRKLGNKKLKNNLKDPAALREAAIQSAHVGNYSKSLDLWRRFVRLQPRSAEAYLNMGTACWNLGRNEKAAAYAQKALEQDPALKEAKFNLALALLTLGRAGEAHTLLDELVRCYPDYPAAQFLLCVAYACLQKKMQAERLFEKLRTLPIGVVIDESFLDIARRFLAASRCDYARRTLDAALWFGCESRELRSLLTSCRVA
jgi:tetratricopeptide (TPR) repeat protein